MFFSLVIVTIILVGNIPFDVTESELRDKFEQAGPIVSFRYVISCDLSQSLGDV